MGTRGLFGFRKNGIDKTMYNHFDSYPSYLGLHVAEFCAGTTISEMNRICDAIEMVSVGSTPSMREIKFCVNHGLTDLEVSSRSANDWYCLLRRMQGNPQLLKSVVQSAGKAYMIDDSSFIKDSLWCEYAYIINLDAGVLEFWKGFQQVPDYTNRYGSDQNSGYYPCKLELEIPLDLFPDPEDVVELMNGPEESE